MPRRTEIQHGLSDRRIRLFIRRSNGSGSVRLSLSLILSLDRLSLLYGGGGGAQQIALDQRARGRIAW
jgi:hypothetical protein